MCYLEHLINLVAISYCYLPMVFLMWRKAGYVWKTDMCRILWGGKWLTSSGQVDWGGKGINRMLLMENSVYIGEDTYCVSGAWGKEGTIYIKIQYYPALQFSGKYLYRICFHFLCDIKAPQHFPGNELWKICGLYLSKYCKSTSEIVVFQCQQKWL